VSVDGLFAEPREEFLGDTPDNEKTCPSREGLVEPVAEPHDATLGDTVRGEGPIPSRAFISEPIVESNDVALGDTPDDG